MFFIGVFFTLILSANSLYECDFDYGRKCLPDLPTITYLILNESSTTPRQPISDVSAIQTSNDQGECYFPFQINSFEMFFCEGSDPNLPPTCPTFNATGPRINCSEGEYGYEEFQSGETGSRSHKLDLRISLPAGQSCFRFYYYLSDQNSNASIELISEDSFTNINQTIFIVSSQIQNRWQQIRQSFTNPNSNPNIYFVFTRELAFDSLPFYIAIDDITITDLECEPTTTTTTTTTIIINTMQTSISTQNGTGTTLFNTTTIPTTTRLNTTSIRMNITNTTSTSTSTTSTTSISTSKTSTTSTTSLSSLTTSTTNSSSTIKNPSKMAQLQVTVVEAINIKKKDFFSESDPYVEIYLDKHTSKQKTKVKRNSKNPHWDQSFFFNHSQGQDSLFIDVLDEDLFKNDQISSLTVDLRDLYEKRHIDQWFDLPSKHKHSSNGQIHLILDYRPLKV